MDLFIEVLGLIFFDSVGVYLWNCLVIWQHMKTLIQWGSVIGFRCPEPDYISVSGNQI